MTELERQDIHTAGSRAERIEQEFPSKLAEVQAPVLPLTSM